MDDSQPEPDVFIGHIHEEKPIALILKDFLLAAFGPDLKVFVSSDPVSIGGGRPWFDHIIRSLKGSKVLLALVSDESKRREWINFEAGFAAGVGAPVIPVGIKNFSLSKLSFPLIGYNGRSVDDIEGIIYDVESQTGRTAARPDRLEYLNAVRSAEDKLIYKSVVLRPYLEFSGDEPHLHFEIYNQGNVDVDLLHVDVLLPKVLCSQLWPLRTHGARSAYKEVLDGVDYYHIRLTSFTEASDRLEPVLTRSMGPVELRALHCPLRPDISSLSLHEQALPIFHHLHARNYDTKRESTTFRDLPLGRQKQPGT